jgi:hypothetical protein
MLLEVLLAVILPAAVIALIYVAPFILHPTLQPLGADTPGYIWRSGVVRALGLHALRPDLFPAPIQPLGNRPAYPVVAGILQSISGIDPATFAWVSPAIFAAMAGLAASVLAVDGLGEPRVRAPIYAIGVGGSAYVAWTAVGYAPNLAFDGIALVIALVVLLHQRERASPLFGGVLLGAGLLTHWMFATAFAGVLLEYAGILAWVRWYAARSARQPEPGEAKIPSGAALRGMWTVLASSVVVGAVGVLVVAPERPDALPPVNEADRLAAVAVKLVARDPGLLLVVTVPLAIVAIVFGLGGARRWPTVLVALWAFLAVEGLVAWYGLHLPFPPYRWSAFALGLPILAIAAGPWTAQAVAARAGPLRAPEVGLAVAVLVSAVLVGGGIGVWWNKEPQMTPEDRVQLALASSYLAPLPEETPVIVVVSPRVRNLPIDRVFSGLPAERLPHVQVVAARVNEASADLGLGIPIPPGAVVLVPQAFSGRDEVRDGTELGPGLRLLAGPAPPAPIPVPPSPRAPGAVLLAWYVALSLAVATLAGWGWSLLIDVPVAGRLALSPVVGTAMLGLVGMALARVGVRPDGPGAVADLALTITSGLVVGVLASGRRSIGDPRPGARFIGASDGSEPPAPA